MRISGRSVGCVVAAVAALPLAGCASEDDKPSAAGSGTPSSSFSYDPAEQRKKDAIANLTDFFSVYVPMGDDYFSRKEAACISEKVVEEPGIKRLQKVGVLNDELQYVIDAKPKFGARDADALTDAIFSCSDTEQLLRKEAVADIDGATPEQKACAADKLTDDLLADLFVLALQEKPMDPAVAKVAEAFAPCKDV